MQGSDPVIVDQINKKLLDYGRSLDGRPIWRVSWSNDQYEVRVGEHPEWSPSGKIFLRSWVGPKKVRKYSYLPDKYILERLTFLPLDSQIVLRELPESRGGTYEPIYVFHNKDMQPLPVTWLAVEYALDQLQNGPGYTSSTAREQMQEKYQDLEVEYMEEKLNEWGRSPLFAREIPSVVKDSTKVFRG